jgi:hypothetical protein
MEGADGNNRSFNFLFLKKKKKKTVAIIVIDKFLMQNI